MSFREYFKLDKERKNVFVNNLNSTLEKRRGKRFFFLKILRNFLQSKALTDLSAQFNILLLFWEGERK